MLGGVRWIDGSIEVQQINVHGKREYARYRLPYRRQAAIATNATDSVLAVC